jgi:uncharacterized membrane protein
MNMITMHTLIPIASAVLAAIASILARILLKGIPTKKILAVNFFTMATTLLVISPFFYKFIFSWKSLALVFLIAIIDTSANYFYFKTFENTEASVAIPILSLAPVITFLFSAIFLREFPPIVSVISALAIMCLIIVISTDWKDLSKFSRATLYPALISSFLFGISAIPSKYLLSTIAATNAPTLYMIRAGLIALFSLLIFKDSFSVLDIKTYRFVFLRGLFVISQWVLLYYALTLGSTGVAVTLGNITPIFVFIFSLIFLQEKPTVKKVIASVLVLILSLFI